MNVYIYDALSVTDPEWESRTICANCLRPQDRVEVVSPLGIAELDRDDDDDFSIAGCERCNEAFPLVSPFILHAATIAEAGIDLVAGQIVSLELYELNDDSEADDLETGQFVIELIDDSEDDSDAHAWRLKQAEEFFAGLNV